MQTLVIVITFLCGITFIALSTANKDESYQMNRVQVAIAPPPSQNYELLRRRIRKNINHMWRFALTNLNNNKETSDPLLELFAEHKISLLNDLDLLRLNDGHEQFRQSEMRELGEIVQKRLQHIQNPKDCPTARKIRCEMPGSGCGFGCRIHELLLCLLVAYKTERTFVLESKHNVSGFLASGVKWEDVFLPLSETCTTSNGIQSVPWNSTEADVAQVIQVPRALYMKPAPDYLPLAIPADLADRLTLVHDDPSAWWSSQLIKYIMRYNSETLERIEQRERSIGFTSPIVGVQIRRTDKLLHEAEFHALEEYMEQVEDFYRGLEMRLDSRWTGIRRVFIATDDPAVIAEAINKYPDYDIVADQAASNVSGITGVLGDLHILSRCDFLVCTFSSNVCRLAYEMRLARDEHDAGGKYVSLDSDYYVFRPTQVDLRATLAHGAKGRDELDLLPGDVITENGKGRTHSDYLKSGFGHAFNTRTNRSGTYPLFKADRVVKLHTFPLYTGV